MLETKNVCLSACPSIPISGSSPDPEQVSRLSTSPSHTASQLRHGSFFSVPRSPPGTAPFINSFECAWRLASKNVKKKGRKRISTEREKAPEVLITDRLSSFFAVWLLGSLAGSCAVPVGRLRGRRVVGWDLKKCESFFWRQQFVGIVSASLRSAGASCTKMNMTSIP